MADEAEQRSKGISAGTLAALGAAALNVVGGATIGRAWLYDLGQRYYDALGDGFSLPPGTFSLSPERLISAGWEITRQSALFSAFVGLVVVPSFCLAGWMIITFLERKRRRAGGEALPLGPHHRFEMVTLLTYLAGIFILAAGIASFNAMAVLPEKARQAGEARANRINIELHKTQGPRLRACPSCRAYGASKLTGLPIIADNRAFYVAGLNGHVTAIPIQGLDVGMPDQ